MTTSASRLSFRRLATVAGFLLLLSHQNAHSQEDRAPTPEQVVRDSVANDGWADLKGHELTPEFVEFLEDLLTGRLEELHVHSKGVRIRNGRFAEDIDWSNAEVKYNLELERSTFQRLDLSQSNFLYNVKMEGCGFGDLDLAQAHFKKGLSLRDSRLLRGRSLGEVDFRGMTVDADVDLSHADFQRARSVSFEGAQIQKNFRAQFAKLGTAGATNLDFRNMSVGGNLDLQTSELRGTDLLFASLSVDGSANFKAKVFDGNASFTSLVVGEEADFRETEFKNGEIDFVKADINTGLDFDYVQFLSSEPVQFNSLKVKHSATFRGARFSGPVDFSSAEITGDLDFGPARDGDVRTRTTFERSARFDNISVDADFIATSARFRGGADFSGLEVKGSVDVHWASLAGNIDFSNADVAGDFQSESAYFNGRVLFSSVKIGGDLRGDKAKFTGRNRLVNFNGTEIEGNVKLADAQFCGDVNFASSQITRDFVADGAHFFRDADFRRMKLQGTAKLRATFSGDAHFDQAHIGGDFDLGSDLHPYRLNDLEERPAGVDAQGPSRVAKFEALSSFNGMSVSRTAWLNGAIFSGAADLRQVEIRQNLIADYAQFEKRATLNEIKVERQASFVKTVFRERVEFQKAEMTHALLDWTDIQGNTDLKHAKFGTLEIQGVGAPESARELSLDYISYDRLVSSEEADSRLGWLQQADFSIQAYGELEDALENDGELRLADEVYIQRKQKEDAAGSIWRRSASIVIYHLVAYGRKTYIAFLWSALVVLIGYAVFLDPRDVQPRDTPDAEESRKQQFDALFQPTLENSHPFRPYNPLWFSLDLFIPFVNLRSLDLWMPRPDQPGRTHWARIQTVLGWILVPIGLASITGIVK